MWCPMVFGLVYGIFNIIYIVAFDGTDPYGHDYVYDILDWNNNPGNIAGSMADYLGIDISNLKRIII